MGGTPSMSRAQEALEFAQLGRAASCDERHCVMFRWSRCRAGADTSVRRKRWRRVGPKAMSLQQGGGSPRQAILVVEGRDEGAGPGQPRLGRPRPTQPMESQGARGG